MPLRIGKGQNTMQDWEPSMHKDHLAKTQFLSKFLEVTCFLTRVGPRTWNGVTLIFFNFLKG